MPKISSVPKKPQNLVDVQKSFSLLFALMKTNFETDIMLIATVMMFWHWCGKLRVCKSCCWDYDLFSHSNRTLGWINSLTWTPPTRLGTLWHPAETENPDQRPNFWSAKNLHSCGVYAQQCAKLPFNSAACSSLLTSTTSARKVSKVGKSQRSDFWPSSPFFIRLTGDWGGSVWSCYVLFCSPLLPCCFAHTHNVVVARLDTPRLGLATAGDSEQKPRKWKCKAEKPSDPVFSTVLWYNPYLRIRLSVCVTYIPMWLTHYTRANTQSTGLHTNPQAYTLFTG